jgi:hypothetical protein
MNGISKHTSVSAHTKGPEARGKNETRKETENGNGEKIKKAENGYYEKNPILINNYDNAIKA